MTALQKLLVKQSSIREKINSLLGLETRTEDQDAELVQLTAEGVAIEPEIRAAIVAEPDPQDADHGRQRPRDARTSGIARQDRTRRFSCGGCRWA